MNPMESAMIGSGHDTNSDTGDNVHSASDQSGTSGDNSGSGGADDNSNNFDSGGFDGFDGEVALIASERENIRRIKF